MSERHTTARQTERMILPLDRDYLFIGLVVALGFVGFGIWIVQPPANANGQFLGYLTIGVAGIGAIARTAQIIAPQLSFIELADNGFRVTNFLCQRHQPLTPWDDVAKIEVYQWNALGGGWYRGVRISHISTASQTKIALPRKYGYTAEDLAALMISIRDRALQTNTPRAATS
jgi:hypothetical protein